MLSYMIIPRPILCLPDMARFAKPDGFPLVYRTTGIDELKVKVLQTRGEVISLKQAIVLLISMKHMKKPNGTKQHNPAFRAMVVT